MSRKPNQDDYPFSIRSCGYGIYYVERTNGYGYDIIRHAPIYIVPNHGYYEYIRNPDNPDHILLMSQEGLPPSKYELDQLEEDDWKWLRTMVDTYGSQMFKDRLTMLEGERVK